MSFEDDTDWGYTVRAQDSYGETYLDRPILGRDRRIQGSVDYGTFDGPAIVVDPVKYPHQYELLYAKVLDRCMIAGVVHRGLAMHAVFDAVREQMRYSKQDVEALAKWVVAGNSSRGQKLELALFLEHGVGTCREMALATGVMLEMLADRGHIRGQVSIDRNQQWDPVGAKIGGHQWARYTNASGKVFILDVAQGFLGALERSGSAQWNYARPSEREALMRPPAYETPTRIVNPGQALGD
jgi:hypothetical protein